MTAPDRPRPSRAALLLVLGALTWVPARYGVMTTWSGSWLGLDYAGWNRAMLIPLALLAGGAITAARSAATRAVAVAWSLVATGWALSWVGVAIEFVVGGGLRGGPRELAVGGWTIYLIGAAVTAVGALVLAAALAEEGRQHRRGRRCRRRRDPRLAAVAGGRTRRHGRRRPVARRPLLGSGGPARPVPIRQAGPDRTRLTRPRPAPPRRRRPTGARGDCAGVHHARDGGTRRQRPVRPAHVSEQDSSPSSAVLSAG